MIVKRKKPLLVEAIQFNSADDIKAIFAMQENCNNSNNRIITRAWESIYANGKKIQFGSWIVAEGNCICIYSSDQFEILFEREKTGFAIPTMADIA